MPPPPPAPQVKRGATHCEEDAQEHTIIYFKTAHIQISEITFYKPNWRERFSPEAK
jgi:hypothetical protein